MEGRWLASKETDLWQTGDRPLICATKEPTQWSAHIRNPPYKATCHPSPARFAARRSVTSATCTCTCRCTRGRNLTAAAFAGSAAAPRADYRSTSVATLGKNLSAARFVARASPKWLTSKCTLGSTRGRSRTAALCAASASAALTKSKGISRHTLERGPIFQDNDIQGLVNSPVFESESCDFFFLVIFLRK